MGTHHASDTVAERTTRHAHDHGGQAEIGHHPHAGHETGHGHDKHAGHDPEMFRRLFWWNLALAVPVLVFSEQIQEWFGYSIDGAWAAWLAPVLGTVIYLWGGQPFLKGGVVGGPQPPARDDAADRAGDHGRVRVVAGARRSAGVIWTSGGNSPR